MSNSTLATTSSNGMDAETMEKALVGGDLASMSAEQRLAYYKAVCDSLGINPLTKPFGYIKLNNVIQLYALKNCAEQLRETRNVQITRVEKERIDELYIVTVYGHLPNGRTDSEIGAVSIAGLKGENLANAMMKAVTKAKRRFTLSICGLGMLDETEADSIPANRRQFVEVDHETGEILDHDHAAYEHHRTHNVAYDNPMTPNQKRYIEALARDCGMDKATLTQFVESRHSNRLYEDLSKSDAGAIIEALQDLKDRQAKAGFDTGHDRAPRATPGAPASQQQMAKLFAEAKERGWHEDQIRGRAIEIRLGVAEEGLGSLDRAQLSELIEAVIKETPWVDPRQQRLDVDAMSTSSHDDQKEDVADYDGLLDRLKQSGDSATLASAWSDVVEAGYEMDTAMFGVAYELIKAFLLSSETIGEWSRAMNDSRAIGVMDDELKTLANERKKELTQQQG